MPRCCATFSQSGRTTFFFFFFCGSRSRLFKNIPVCLRPQGRSPRCRGDCFSVMSVRSCFLTKKHLWALFSPKPPSLLLLDWREPQRGRAKTTQRASDRKAKKVEPPFFFSVKLHKYFYFWRGQLQGSLSLSLHTNERSFVLFVFRRDAGWKKKKKKVSCWCRGVWVIAERGSGWRWRGSNSWVFRLYMELQVRTRTAQLRTIPSLFLMTKTHVAVRKASPRGQMLWEGTMVDPGETPTQIKTRVRQRYTSFYLFNVIWTWSGFVWVFFPVMRPKFVRLRHQLL